MGVVGRILKLHICPVSHLFEVFSFSIFRGYDTSIKNRDRLNVSPLISCKDLIFLFSRNNSWFLLIWLISLLYFPLEEAASLEFHWIAKLIVRDVILTVLIIGGWDWITYGRHSPWRKEFQPFKLNGRYPYDSQFYRDVLGTMSSTVISSGMEASMLYLYASGEVAYTLEFKWVSLLMVLGNTYFREIYYYLTHRLIHPWRTKRVPDLGRWLYRYVHSFHHKSYLPTPWNGLSLHPV